MKRENGERLTHEDVINRLENETVSYEVGTGMGGAYTDLFRVSIKVETALYETAISWLKDLIYHAEFDKERLSVVLAKIQQSLPELKRDGNTVLNSLWTSLIYNEKCTSRSAGVLALMEFIPQLTKNLQEKPDEVIKDFEDIRNYLTKPSGLRFSVTGNVRSVDKPRSTWGKYFSLPVSLFPPYRDEAAYQFLSQPVPLSPVPSAAETLSDTAKQMSRKAVVMSLPTIESSFVTHSSKGIQGYDNPDYPPIRVALEVLNATESFLWVCLRDSFFVPRLTMPRSDISVVPVSLMAHTCRRTSKPG